MRRLFSSQARIAWLILGIGLSAQGAQDDLSPELDRLTERSFARDERAVPGPAEKIPPHEAILAPAADRKMVEADKAPPQKIVERPGEVATNPNARWVEGYWDWDRTRKDFDWVTGTWLVPPPGKFWVSGYWRHADKGWSRVPGFWSDRVAAMTAGRVDGAVVARDWKRSGPPPERPSEAIGTAPGAEFFYIPGEYVPRGEFVVWKPGFWYHAQPGWEWNPARWVRQSTGWAFREGSWGRVAEPLGSPPRQDPAVQAATIVSTPAGTSMSRDDLNATSLTPISAVTPSRDPQTPPGGDTTPLSGTSATARGLPNGGALSSPGLPALNPQPGPSAGTMSAGFPAPAYGLAPTPYGPGPLSRFPGGDKPRNDIFRRGGPQQNPRGGIGRFLNRLLPY